MTTTTQTKTGCACGSGAAYEACCGPLIEAKQPAPTAEALMRSRYTAFTRAAVDYLMETHSPKTREEVSREAIEAWAKDSEWLGFELRGTEEGGKDDSEGIVRFRARYRQKGRVFEHLEVAQFAREDGVWKFVTAFTPPAKHEAPKVGRNDPCPCGSGKKHKKCCGG